MSRTLFKCLNRTYEGLFRTSIAQSSRLSSSSTAQPHSQKMALDVEHDEVQKCFFIQLKNDEGKYDKAVLEYEWIKDGVIDLYHTEVPPVFRGKGVAKLLAKSAMDYVIERDAKMVLTCTYLVKYVKENPLPEYTSRAVGKL